MNSNAIVRAIALVLALFCSAESYAAVVQPVTSIASMTEPGEALTVQSLSAQTGHVTFASSGGRGILLSVAAGASAQERALKFVEAYGKPFGLTSAADVAVMREPQMDSLGAEHVRLQQTHKGIPVRAAEVMVHMKGARVMAVNGHAIDDLPNDVSPAVPSGTALAMAGRLIAKHRPDAAAGTIYSDPRLEIINRALLAGTGNDISRLAWFIEASATDLRQFIWIDARTGGVILSFSQLTDAKNRTVYTSNHTDTLPGSLVRTEGGAATGDTDQDKAYDYAGVTYDYYLTYHGRDSFDNAGGELRSSAHYCKDTCPAYQNAFWNGKQMVYGDGYAAADDVVAHELTHAVTEKTAALLYYVQSGALNESFSDIFGETVDLLDGVGNDASAKRWKMGEDLPGSESRDMMTPTNFQNPGKMTDSYFVCSLVSWTDANADHGGVHTNSGIPNHAYALMVDGGTYNGKTVTGIGLTKAAKIEYRALTTYLTSGAGFLDDYNALNQSCTDLIGTVGITSGDCTQVKNALDAVEMAQAWACSGATPAPAKCPSGNLSSTAFEGFESSLGNWTATAGTSGTWTRDSGFAKTGSHMVYGSDPDGSSDHTLTMTNAVTIPSGARMYFDHSFEFENGFATAYDGGVVEYSTNGTTWSDAGSLIDAGQAYNGTLGSYNPLGARRAFAASSFGYTGTRLDLSSLAGQNVKFRFRIGADYSTGSLGWLLDNIQIYRCIAPQLFTDDPLVAGTTAVKAVHITELRTRINAVRTALQLAAFSWTDSNLAAGAGIRAVHITELRTAIDQAYTAASRTAPAYTDSGLSSGFTIKAAHIRELRTAVQGLE